MTTSIDARTGGCLCGAVAYAAGGPLQSVLHCHCENCRRISGNFVAASRSETAELSITDPGGRLRWHDLGYARYGFCGECGSTLFYQASDRRHLTSLMAGTLDDTSALSVGGVWYADEAQPHTAVAPDTPRFDGNA